MVVGSDADLRVQAHGHGADHVVGDLEDAGHLVEGFGLGWKYMT